MTTSLRQATGIDAGSLEDLLAEGGVRTRVVAGVAPVAAPPPSVDLPVAAHAAGAGAAGAEAAAREIESIPDAAAFALHFNRSLRTAAPLAAADALAVVAAGVLTQTLLSLLGVHASSVLGAAAPLALLPLLIGYWLCGLYSEVWIHPAVELRQATHVSTVALFAAALAGWWAPPLSAWCALAWAPVVVMVPLARALARKCCAGQAWWGFPTLVIGSGDAADRLARSLMRTRTCGLRPALVTDPDGACRASAVPVMNDAATLRSIVRSKGIRHAVLCISDLPATKLTKAFNQYGSMASHLLVIADAPPLPALWGAQRVCGLGGVEVRNGLLLAPLRVVKRVMDITLASTVLLAGLPLLLAIAAMVKLSGPGGVLYGHKRIGRHGRKFTAWKFRTMHRGADTLLRQHFERFPAARIEWERDQKLRDDPRVTPVGRFLRRLSLDELPQMWNVLRGEMSVVGPRPIVDDEVPRYGELFDLYTVVKPGITGLWQVSGRTDVGYEMRVRLDEFYVRHWSPWLDAYVLVRTVVALLCRRGAY